MHILFTGSRSCFSHWCACCIFGLTGKRPQWRSQICSQKVGLFPAAFPIKMLKDVSRYIFWCIYAKAFDWVHGSDVWKIASYIWVKSAISLKGNPAISVKLYHLFHCCCCSWVENYLLSLHFTAGAPMSAHFNPFHIVHLKSWSPWMSLDSANNLGFCTKNQSENSGNDKDCTVCRANTAPCIATPAMPCHCQASHSDSKAEV